MQKKVLVIYYTQSGQMEEILQCFLAPFSGGQVTVELLRIKPVNDFPFPWNSERFFDAMPESVLAIPAPVHPVQPKESKYDLVVLAYQPWFLSVSIPVNSALHHPAVQSILKDTPVVTLIAARNMWINAQERVRKILKDAGAKLVGNIALVDRNANPVSAVTILYWMMTGKKDSYLGIFPKAGVAEEDVTGSEKYGQSVYNAFAANDWNGLQNKLVQDGAVEVKSNLLFIEERAPRLFSIWANFIIKRQNRKAWLVVFKYYLLFALFIVAPIVLTIYTVFFSWMFYKSTKQKKAYYAGVD